MKQVVEGWTCEKRIIWTSRDGADAALCTDRRRAECAERGRCKEALGLTARTKCRRFLRCRKIRLTAEEV